ncbi:helix-turn-helix domain-containing protein, partial [Streptomyces sp. P9(2023)]
MKLLRQALGDDSRRPRYIRSVRGRGYQLCAPPRPASASPTRSSRARRLGWDVVAVAVLGTAATLLLLPRSTPQGAG